MSALAQKRRFDPAPALPVSLAPSLPPRNPAHIGQMMRNALVAIDAGLLAAKQKALVCERGAWRLLGDIHRLRAVTVAALQGIIGLEACPFVQRELKPLIEEFFACIDGAEDFSPNLVRRLHFARDFVGPVVRNMAVWTGGAHAGAV